MLTRNDCLSILVKLEDNGINIDSYMKKLLISPDIPLEVLQFIIQNQGVEVTNFYEMLRKKHNKNRSPLYTNILKEKNSLNDVTTTLVCLLTQIVLYSNKLTDTKDSFLKEVRAEEISRVLNTYFKTSEITECIELLRLIKTDILVLEYLNNKRELTVD